MPFPSSSGGRNLLHGTEDQEGVGGRSLPEGVRERDRVSVPDDRPYTGWMRSQMANGNAMSSCSGLRPMKNSIRCVGSPAIGTWLHAPRVA